MSKLAALVAASLLLTVAPANAAGKWHAWKGSKGPMLFQVGAAHTTKNCFGDCSSKTMTFGRVYPRSSSNRTYTDNRVYVNEPATPTYFEYGYEQPYWINGIYGPYFSPF